MKAKKLLLSILASLCVGFSVLTVASCATGGLEYTLNNGTYSLAGIGTAIVKDDIVIPSVYKNKPVTRIDERAFEGCVSLTSITIPDSVSSIGNYAFASCPLLMNVTIPDSVISLGECAFAYCKSLESAIVGNGVVAVSENAFAYCSSLESVTVGIGVTKIGGGAFYGCDNLTDVYYAGTKTQWNSINIDYFNAPLTKATIHYNYEG